MFQRNAENTCGLWYQNKIETLTSWLAVFKNSWEKEGQGMPHQPRDKSWNKQTLGTHIYIKYSHFFNGCIYDIGQGRAVSGKLIRMIDYCMICSIYVTKNVRFYYKVYMVSPYKVRLNNFSIVLK